MHIPTLWWIPLGRSVGKARVSEGGDSKEAAVGNSVGVLMKGPGDGALEG